MLLGFSSDSYLKKNFSFKVMLFQLKKLHCWQLTLIFRINPSYQGHALVGLSKDKEKCQINQRKVGLKFFYMNSIKNMYKSSFTCIIVGRYRFVLVLIKLIQFRLLIINRIVNALIINLVQITSSQVWVICTLLFLVKYMR